MHFMQQQIKNIYRINNFSSANCHARLFNYFRLAPSFANADQSGNKYISRLFVVVGFTAALSTTANVQADVMLGASLPNDGFSRTVIADFNQVNQKELAYVNVFSAFSHDWDNLYWQSSNVVAEGAMPMISWMPIDLSRREDNLLPEIAIGMWDDYLMQWGTRLLAWVNSYPDSEQPRLSIRFAHEFNGNWYPYSNSPVAYTAAWQHIHDMFSEMGVNDHVDWVWSASKTNVDDYGDFTVYYPGESYVDWTSLDGYNWGSNYAPGGWSSFSEIFDESYQIMVANYPDKPIMIAETASAEPHDLPNTQYGMYGDDSDAFESKSVWMREMLVDLEYSYPAVRALSLFNINKELSWSISNESNTGLDAWIMGTQSAHFTSDFLSVGSFTDTDQPEIPKGNGKGKSKTNGKNKDRETTRMVSQKQPITVRTIDTSEQIQIAGSSRSAMAKTRKNVKLENAFRTMPEHKQSAFRSLKYSVVDY